LVGDCGQPAGGGQAEKLGTVFRVINVIEAWGKLFFKSIVLLQIANGIGPNLICFLEKDSHINKIHQFQMKK
jgi:hypothetical protein